MNPLEVVMDAMGDKPLLFVTGSKGSLCAGLPGRVARGGQGEALRGAGQTLWAPKVTSPRPERVPQIGLCQPLRLWALRGGDTPAVSCLPVPRPPHPSPVP